MIANEIRARIEQDVDFVNLKRFDFSLQKLIERYPDGCSTRVISHALLLTEVEVEELYQQAVRKLQDLMGVKKDV